MLIMLFKILLSFWMTSIKQVMQTQSHAVLSFEVKSKRSLVKLRHQIKHNKAFLLLSSPQRPHCSIEPEREISLSLAKLQTLW